MLASVIEVSLETAGNDRTWVTVARQDTMSCDADWSMPPPVNLSESTTIAEQAYAARATGHETVDCGCAPCGSKAGNMHSGYWKFMANPGPFCRLNMHAPEDDCGVSFASLAKGSLRGKRVLIYGESVMMQIFFAM